MNPCTVLALILHRHLAGRKFLTPHELSMIAEVFGNRMNAERIAVETGERYARETWLTALVDQERKVRA